MGRDVESMIRDLVEHGHRAGAQRGRSTRCRRKRGERGRGAAARPAAAGPPASPSRRPAVVRAVATTCPQRSEPNATTPREARASAARRRARRPPRRARRGREGRRYRCSRSFSEPGMEDLERKMGDMLQRDVRGQGAAKRRKLSVGEARRILDGARRPSSSSTWTRSCARPSSAPSRRASSSSTRSTRLPAREAARRAPDVSREGVQRDLLPIVEGTPSTPSTARSDRPRPLHRRGRVPRLQAVSDLIPELQGRFPIAWSWSR